MLLKITIEYIVSIYCSVLGIHNMIITISYMKNGPPKRMIQVKDCEIRGFALTGPDVFLSGKSGVKKRRQKWFWNPPGWKSPSRYVIIGRTVRLVICIAHTGCRWLFSVQTNNEK